MSYIAKRFQGQKASLTLDTEALKKYTDLIDLSIGDTDLITDERIIEAAYQDALAGATRYGMPQGDPELIDAIITAWQEDFGQKVAAEEVLVTASSCLGMTLATMAVLDPGDEVIVFGPYFAVYKQQIELAGGVCVEVQTSETAGYHLNEADLRKAITAKTKAVIINNPANPTGVVYNRSELEMLARVAVEKDLLVLADEIYTRYVFDGEFIPVRTLPGMAERTVTLNSFSKNFMMTGWRVGYIIAPKEIRQTAQMINGGIIYTAPSISQRAAIKALTMRDEVQRLYISMYKERVLYAADRLSRISYLTLAKPHGTFYLFPGVKKTGLTSEEFCKAALEKTHILLSPGTAFGISGAGHVRIACTASEKQIREAMDRLESAKF